MPTLGSKLYHGEKYTMTEAQINAYTWQMNLTINDLKKSDFGAYVCSSINALGKSDARIRLQGTRKMIITMMIIGVKTRFM